MASRLFATLRMVWLISSSVNESSEDVASSNTSSSGFRSKARAMEIDPHYCDVAVRRWQTYTGKSAVLAATGETFELTEEQRSAVPAAA